MQRNWFSKHATECDHVQPLLHSSSLATGPNQKRLQTCQLPVTTSSLTHLLHISLTFSLYTPLPGSFVLLQTHGCIAFPTLEQKSLASVCRDKCKLIATNILSRQNYVCHDKYLSQQNVCRDKNVRCDKSFVAISVLLSRQKTCLSWQTRVCQDKNYTCGSSRQWYFCRDKGCVLSRQTRACHDKSKFVVTKFLSRQNCVCHDFFLPLTKMCLSRQTYICRDKTRLLSRQKWYLWQLLPMIVSLLCSRAIEFASFWH